MMVIDNKYSFGQIVYLKTDPEQREHMEVAMCMRPGLLEYQLAQGSAHSWHQEFAISETKDVLKSTTN